MIPVLFWLLVTANAAGFGTLVVGWWALAIVAVAAGFAAPERARPLLTVPLGALIGWGILLFRSARVENFPALTELLDRLLPVPSLVLAGTTLLLAAVLGMGGALVGSALRRQSDRDGHTAVSAS